MTDWRDTGPQIEAERAKLREFETQTADLSRAECEEILDRVFHAGLASYQVLLCGRKPGPVPLADLRSMAAEMLYLMDEDQNSDHS